MMTSYGKVRKGFRFIITQIYLFTYCVHSVTNLNAPTCDTTIEQNGRIINCNQECRCIPPCEPFILTCINHKGFPTVMKQDLVTVLDMSQGNTLTILTSGQLQKANMRKLVHLNLQGCSISLIERGAFRGGESISELNLSRNNIAVLDPQVFLGLDNLQILKLQQNPINHFQHETIFPPLKLVELDLNNCQLTNLPMDAFLHLKDLQKLSIKSNQLTTCHWTLINHMTNLREFDAVNNPWHCDCQVTFLKETLYNMKLIMPLYNLTCTTFSTKNNKQIVAWIDIKNDTLPCPPTIEKLEMNLGNDVRFECKFSGYPPPKVKWFFSKNQTARGEAVDIGSPKILSTNPFTTNWTDSYTIRNVSYEHDGFYTCLVGNAAGFVNQTIHLGTKRSEKLTTVPGGEKESGKLTWVLVGVGCCAVGVVGIGITTYIYRRRKLACVEERNVQEESISLNSTDETKWEPSRKKSNASRDISGIVVGSDECSINDVVLTIRSTASYPRLGKKWTDVGRAFKNKSIRRLQNNLTLDKCQMTDVLDELILEWVAKEAGNATLEKLVNIFDKQDFKDIADALKKKFGR